MSFLGADFDRDKLEPYVNEDYVNAYKIIFGSVDALSVCSQKTKDLIKEFKLLFNDSVEASTWCGIDIYNDVERAIDRNRAPDLEKSECYLQAKAFLRYKFTKHLIDRINSLKRDKTVEFSEVEGFLRISKMSHDKTSLLALDYIHKNEKPHCKSTKKPMTSSFSSHTYNYYFGGADYTSSLDISAGAGVPDFIIGSGGAGQGCALPFEGASAPYDEDYMEVVDIASIGKIAPDVGSKSKLKARRRLGL